MAKMVSFSVVMAVVMILFGGVQRTLSQSTCTYTIKIRTGTTGTDERVDLRLFSSDESVLDFSDLDGPGDDFESNQVNTFTFTGRECHVICAAKLTLARISIANAGIWSFETISVTVSNTSQTKFFAVGEPIRGGTSRVVGPCT
ncbi:uncharacterized protein LOC112340555 [Selaginella moellendorffii]|uniref:uncharacterized protein LOC112340555 n=1 Tax=Selaginella moellendorffii TaxID=88036 RepID=UPI000D1C4956|nr:uncharacterized protein LOC112340555 [Selaginella moellendorffii]|eukprot:XP_024514959.1 uncharacterized protein LOC112340555 [Selaginella moellendorffii]